MLLDYECFDSTQRISELMRDASVRECQQLILALLVFEVLNRLLEYSACRLVHLQYVLDVILLLIKF